jgi:L-lactate dehydrogenase complex protein LldG
MNARDEILGRLQRQARPVAMPPAWDSPHDYDDLAGQFTRALQAAHGEVWRVADLAGALAQLGEILDELGVKTAVANAEPPLVDANLPDRFPAIRWRFAGESSATDWRTDCAAADVGLSSADAALAETGSVVISSGPGRSRLATLLPPVHIVLLPITHITADLFTWTQACPSAPPANITLVSGPSKTADIEQTMAIGVHGPKRFIVVVYGPFRLVQSLKIEPILTNL